MTSDTQKKARNKWDSNNMSVLGCKLRKDEAEAFKEACQKKGTTPNAIFRQAIAEFMERQQGETVEPPTGTETQAGVVVVSPGAIQDENICSRFISQWGPDFQSILDASGQTAEDYIKQAVAERMRRETKRPTPDV